VRVVSTSSLPVDLNALVRARIPDARVDVPDRWIGIDAVDLADADALVCLLMDRVDGSVLARAPKLKVIANCAVGLDNVDVAAATFAGVAVTNTPDVLTEATAELTIALMFAAARRLPEAERLVRGGAWEGWRLDQMLGVQLSGKTLGIVGYGRIGRAVGAKARALGMRVVYTEDPSGAGGDATQPVAMVPPTTPTPSPVPAMRVTLDQLLATADVISLHCPLTRATKNLVDAARLAAMKPTAILVNTARGACVDLDALVDALTAGRLFAAALDVFPDEPRIEPRLLACPRAVLAPHIGSATTEARTQMAKLCADAVVSVLTGSRPPNMVNEVWIG